MRACITCDREAVVLITYRDPRDKGDQRHAVKKCKTHMVDSVWHLISFGWSFGVQFLREPER